tara:strand:+ start:1323 stop:1712 length:390 start_codon:yes stop_codon:yes gene_type:complete
MINLQFLRFLMAGGFAAVANFGSRFFFSIFFEYGFSVFFAYIVGMLVAFTLMRGHVFNASQGSLTPQVTKFVLVNVLAVLQTLVISLLLARWLLAFIGVTNQAEALAHMVGILVPVVTSYFLHKFFTFR